MSVHIQNIVSAGVPLEQATKAMIMVHGRGGSAEDILSLSAYLDLQGMALLAPQANQNTWYPYGFMSPVSRNQPALDSSLATLDKLVKHIFDQGIAREHLYFTGFSQGACLTLEYTTRHAARYGGIIAFTGGLIGEALDTGNYQGDFKNTPVLITTGDPDPHVPVSRVNESAGILKKMNADLTVKIYKGRPHTISEQEIELANSVIRS